MENKKQLEKYEKPTLGFENLKLSEQIAAVCFGNGNGGLDSITYYGEGGPININVTSEGNNGCGGQNTANKIMAALSDNGINISLNGSVCNTKDSRFMAPTGS